MAIGVCSVYYGKEIPGKQHNTYTHISDHLCSAIAKPEVLTSLYKLSHLP